MPSPKTAWRNLWFGIAAALAASACCVAPLVLVILGIGGAWIATLTALEPYRPIFVAVTLVFLALAFRQLYRVAPVCAPNTACPSRPSRRHQRVAFWIVTPLLLALLAFPWYATWWIE